MSRSYQAYLFDLDGTLLDTAPDIHAALIYALAQADLPKVDEALTRHWVGHGSKALVTQALAYHNAAIDPQPLVDHFLHHYRKHINVYSQPYPTVLNVLQQLNEGGKQLAVVTNKLAELTEPLLHASGLARWFDLVVCGDTTAQPKPAADPIRYCLDRFQLGPDQALMVGDSGTDVGAARAAGVDVACVRYGYNQGVDVALLQPDYVVDVFDELPINP